MSKGIIYFNSTCGAQEFEKLDFAYQCDLKVLVDEKEVNVKNALELKQLMDGKKIVPKTSQPSTNEIMKAYETALSNHDEGIIVVTPSKYLSGTHQNSVLASEEFDQSKIKIVESKSFALSEYALINEFIKYKDEKTIDELAEHLTKQAHRLETFIVPLNFEQLKLSGRVSFSKALIATLLKVKIIIRHVEPDIGDTKSDIADIYFQGRGLNSLFKEVDKILSKENIKKVYFGSSFEEKSLKDNFVQMINDKNLQLVDAGLVSQILYTHLGSNSFGFMLEFNE